MTRIAYFDCPSGISGDMTLGALIDLGVPVAKLESAIRSMGLPDLRLEAEDVKKCGFRAVHVQIHHPPEHAHRHLHHIAEMIQRADQVSPAAQEQALEIFRHVAVAEAKVHGTTIEKVHFHEVGAIDSIADIVGTAVAMDHLGIELAEASPVPTGCGTVKIAHGRVSVPAPATAEIMRGIPIAPSDVPHELTTPTGAAILKTYAKRFGSLPAMKVDRIGYGAGTRDLEGQANILRVMVGETSESVALGAGVESDQVVVLETNIDDSTAEQLADCSQRLMQSGALDVLQIPCTMKKGRAGITLSVIAEPSRVSEFERIIFQHTSTIGIRRYRTDRHKLSRQSVELETRFGKVRGKQVTLPDGEPRLKVEDDDARQLAASHGTTASTVRRAALEVWESIPR